MFPFIRHVARQFGTSPCLPAPKEARASFADRLVKRLCALDPIRAELAEPLTQFAPCNQDPPRLGIGGHRQYRMFTMVTPSCLSTSCDPLPAQRPLATAS